MASSLRLAQERGETSSNVERVSLERSTGAQTGKNGPAQRNQGFEAARRL